MSRRLSSSTLTEISAATLRRQLASLAAEAGYSGADGIPEAMTFRQWCMDLAEKGLQVDGFPFVLADRPSIWFIYDLIPTTIEEARGRKVVMMKCAQVGFTVLEMLACIYMALKFKPAKVGMYLPDRSLAAAKSSERFMPIMRTVPAAYNQLTMDDGTGKRKRGEGNVMIRSMGTSRFHFLWTSGKATTESFPMDVLSFDEVQEMKIADMEKTAERLSASRIKFQLMGSTAKWPDSDIHWHYQRGTQHQFHTRCKSCNVAAPMDEHFPDCIAWDEPSDDYRYRCTACKAWIDDPQHGEWIARNPSARFTSVHYPQFLSPTISAREIIEAYHNADDMMNFYNRKLGKPYADPSQIPVNLAHLNACAAEGMRIGLEWKQRAQMTYMGVDQMGQFNVAIIKERLPDGRQALVHIEYIYAEDPFARCSELMQQYGVQVCCVETLPNYNDAKAFSKRHKGRVFLAGYADIGDEMMHWGDATNTKADRRISDEARDRYTVTLDQYKCMDVSMARITKRVLLFPNPGALVQEVVIKGIRETIPVLKDIAFMHFQRTALVTDRPDPNVKKVRRRVVKVGIDPHTSYANMLCDVAWARAYGTGTMILPDAAATGAPTATAKRIEASMPGLPKAIVAMMDDLPPGTCGRCSSCPTEGPQVRPCSARGFAVNIKDASCPLFSARED